MDGPGGPSVAHGSNLVAPGQWRDLLQGLAPIDGRQADEERARVGTYADALGVERDALEELHVRARLYLLSMLAQGLRNKEAVRAVGIHQLGLKADQIASLVED